MDRVEIHKDLLWLENYSMLLLFQIFISLWWIASSSTLFLMTLRYPSDTRCISQRSESPKFNAQDLHRESNSVAGWKKSDFKIKTVHDNCRNHNRRSFKNKSLSCPMGQLHWQSVSSWDLACLDCWNSRQPSFTGIPPLTSHKVTAKICC